MICEKLVAIFHDLMASDDQVKIMLVQELFHYLLAENVGHSPLIISPLLWYLVENVGTHASCRVRPKDVAQNAEVGDFRRPLKLPDLVKRL